MPASTKRTVLSEAEWEAEGERRFGSDKMRWRFVCPACGHVACAQDYKDAGAPANAVGYSCVGRWTEAKREALTADSEKGPCNYAGGGLLRLNPVTVTTDDGNAHEFFAFDDPDPT